MQPGVTWEDSMEPVGFDLEAKRCLDLQRQRDSKGSAPHVTMQIVMMIKITAIRS